MNKRKILLVNAPVLAVLEPWFDAPKFVRTSLATLAGYLREHTDWEIKCLDAKFEKLSFEETCSRIVSWNPDIVGFTAFTNEIKPSAYLAGLLKRKNSNIITVCGGAHITAIPEETLLEFPTFDIGIVGEGEQTLTELCNAIGKSMPLEGINGLVFTDANNAIVRTPDRMRILDQDSLPMPAWDMLPKAEEYYIQTVRGCPFNCTFCLNHNGRVARKRGVEKVISEMEWLINDFQPKRISFGDELFSVDMKRTEELLDAIIEKKIGERVSWDIQTHVAFVNDNLLRKMKLANLAKIEMGVESGDDYTLKKMGKGTNREMIIKAFDTAHKYKLKTGSFFIIGQPNETHKTIWKSIILAIQINPSEPIFGTMVPYPGTEVAKLAAKKEAGYKLLTTDWDEYRKQLNGSMEISSMSRTMLEWYQIIGYLTVFIANFRFFSLLKFFWNYRGGAVNLFKKAIRGKKNTSTLFIKPTNYDEVIGSRSSLTIERMASVREDWKAYQAREIKRTRKEHPSLINEQIPI